ncbi:uncharacterized protein LOC100901319 [Galendromus occidentalis]|uniref:Uncharacterized protein LOC100901319 n=1 Tax=Galendromus occidentalis TaxID=34638 RepID=A0AAJ6QXC5_9ACAR|nr:uncharacterized protein LOC100901319 [Galendromus occidentalis]
MTSRLYLVWAVVAICSFPEDGLGARRFPYLECYNEKTACSSPKLREMCYYTRWSCRDLGYGDLVKNDTTFPMISGKCDRDGPRVFCRSKKAAAACRVDQGLCRRLGFYYF